MHAGTRLLVTQLIVGYVPTLQVTKRKRATGAWAKLKEKRTEVIKKEPKDAKSVTGPYNPKWASNNKPVCVSVHMHPCVSAVCVERN